MYQRILDYLKEKPALYAPGTALFWNDSHISKGMLEAHLALWMGLPESTALLKNRRIG